jgi:hypothetical protein
MALRTYTHWAGAYGSYGPPNCWHTFAAALPATRREGPEGGQEPFGEIFRNWPDDTGDAEASPG